MGRVDVVAQPEAGVGDRQLGVGHQRGDARRPGRPERVGTRCELERGPAAGEPERSQRTARRAGGRGCRARARPACRPSPRRAPPAPGATTLEHRGSRALAQLERVAEQHERGRLLGDARRAAAPAPAGRRAHRRRDAMPRCRSETIAVATVAIFGRRYLRSLVAEGPILVGPRVHLLSPQPLHGRLPDLLEGHGAGDGAAADARRKTSSSARPRKRRAALRRRSQGPHARRPRTPRRGRRTLRFASSACPAGLRLARVARPARCAAARRCCRPRTWPTSRRAPPSAPGARRGEAGRDACRDGGRPRGWRAGVSRGPHAATARRAARGGARRRPLRVARWIMRPGRGWELQDAPVMLPAARFAEALGVSRGGRHRDHLSFVPLTLVTGPANAAKAGRGAGRRCARGSTRSRCSSCRRFARRRARPARAGRARGRVRRRACCASTGCSARSPRAPAYAGGRASARAARADRRAGGRAARGSSCCAESAAAARLRARGRARCVAELRALDGRAGALHAGAARLGRRRPARAATPTRSPRSTAATATGWRRRRSPTPSCSPWRGARRAAPRAGRAGAATPRLRLRLRRLHAAPARRARDARRRAAGAT